MKTTSDRIPSSTSKEDKPIVLVETAFLASTASLIWFINYYFPLGPLLRVFFPVPIALLYLRWGNRAAWMGAAVSGLLLSVLMGPTRSILFVIPFGLMGVMLGGVWKRGGNWFTSIGLGSILGSNWFLFSILVTFTFVGTRPLDIFNYTSDRICRMDIYQIRIISST